MNDRCRGCFLGLCCGDALGQPIEFLPPGMFTPVTDYRNGGPHSLHAGEWTDDTSMALALADSLKRGWNINDQAKRYCDWMEEGKYSVNGWCFDIGSTTRHALQRFLQYQDATKSGIPYPDASGNGGIMRIAPVAIHYANEKSLGIVFDKGVQSSAVTHASEACKSAAGLMTLMLYALINGTPKEVVLEDDWYDNLCSGYGSLPPLNPLIDNIAKGSYKRKSPPAIKGSGFVVQSLEAALWAFWNGKDFRESVLLAVNLGEDSDTTGAVCGQFAGACWGESGIPLEWREGLSRKYMIEDALTGLMP